MTSSSGKCYSHAIPSRQGWGVSSFLYGALLDGAEPSADLAGAGQARPCGAFPVLSLPSGECSIGVNACGEQFLVSRLARRRRRFSRDFTPARGYVHLGEIRAVIGLAANLVGRDRRRLCARFAPHRDGGSAACSARKRLWSARACWPPKAARAARWRRVAARAFELMAAPVLLIQP